LESANVPKEFRHKLFPFAAATAQKTDNLMIVKVNGTEKTRYEHFLENIPAFTKHMRTWGEAGVVKTKTKTSPKLDPKGVVCLFIGYADDHSGDTYFMYDPIRSVRYTTRDVVWLQRMFWRKPRHSIDEQDDIVEVAEDAPRTEPSTDSEPVSTDETPTPTLAEENAGGPETPTPTLAEENAGIENTGPEVAEERPITQTTRSGRQVRLPEAMFDYETGFFTAPEERYNERMKQINELSFCGLSEEIMAVGTTGSNFNNTAELKPMKFDEAMATKDRDGWVKAVEDEYERFNKSHVFKVMTINELPGHRHGR
jgi:hypothetical protein